MKKLKTKKELKTMIKTAKELELKANNAKVLFKVPANSYAHKFAQENGFSFEFI